MLTDLCAEIRNYFLRDASKDIHCGRYEISDGQITLGFLQEGQYFRIVGSVFNDGVWKYGEDALVDETFDGSIWAMAVPSAVMALSEEIDEWVKSNAEALNAPYQSESFGGYSYTKGTNAAGTGGYSWQDHFSGRLNKYRRVAVL